VGKAYRLLLVNIFRCIPLIRQAEVPSRFACAIQPFSVVFYVIRTVHKFDFRPVINEAPHKWRPVFVTNLCYGVIETYVLDNICMFYANRPSER